MKRNGSFPTPGVKDVAALAGVSPSTVSNYLNKPEIVQESTRLKIERAIGQLGFVRNENARQLRAGSSRTLALVLLDAWIPFFAEVARGVEDTGVADGWTVLFSNSARDAERELKSLNVFAAERVNGILVIPKQDLRPQLRQLQRQGITCVTVEPPHHADDISSVQVDHRAGGRAAAEHLLSLGRRKFALIGNPAGAFHVRDRFAGFTAAVESAGASWHGLETAGLTLRDGAEAARRVLDIAPSERPDAVFAANDTVALGVLHELLAGGVDVPGDIAVMGYDGWEFAAHSIIPLSTVAQPAYEMGVAAAKTLIAEMQGDETPGQTHQVFQPVVVSRESTLGRHQRPRAVVEGRAAEAPPQAAWS